MKTIEINGNNFQSLEGFYDEIEKFLIEGECPWGRNLDSLDEIVQANFNYTDDKELDVKMVVWLNFEKSRKELRKETGGKPVIEILEEIFSSYKKIEFLKE